MKAKSASQIVDEVLAEAAAGDDPRLAAAARAEQAYRRERQLDSIRSTFQSVGAQIQRVGQTMKAMNEGLRMAFEPEICDETTSSCECQRPAEHSGPHLCGCAGSWTYDEDGEFLVENLPGNWSGLASLRRQGILPPLQ